MNDPHVVSLKYKLETIDTVSFSEPSAIEAESETFRMKLADGIVVFEFKLHFDSAEAARSIVEPYLRAWEIDNALSMNKQEINFRYIDAEVIDRNPLFSGSSQIIQGQFIESTLVVSGGVSISVTRPDYPPPPAYFNVNTDVESLWQRYERYTRGQEPLPSMAYFMLTWLENYAGGVHKGKREWASKKFAISKEVLDKLANLSTNKGDELSARKRQEGTLLPLTSIEKRWLESVVRAIIRRFGEIDVHPSLKIITMDDFQD